jgi:N-acetylglutamate synthase-like GNAT family acetyltransferase
MIRIRTCKKSDLAKVRALWSDSTAYCCKEAEEKIPFALCESCKDKCECDAKFIIAEEDDNLVAFGSYIKSGDKIAELTDMKVHPEYRDKNLPHILMESLEERAQKEGLQGFYHKTSDKHCQTHDIWYNLGFAAKENVMEESKQYTVYEKLF